jgi:hypothetical protein
MKGGQNLYAGIRSSVIGCPAASQQSKVSEQNIDSVRECIGLFFPKNQCQDRRRWILNLTDSHAWYLVKKTMFLANMSALPQISTYINVLCDK